MKRRSRTIFVLVAAAACAVGTFGGPASAAPIYSYFYVAGQPAYASVPANGMVTVPLYLEEVGPGSSSLLASEDGLSTAGLSVSRSAGLAAITALTGNVGTPPAGFDGTPVTTAVTAAAASLLENTGITDVNGVAAGPAIDGISEVLLGDLTVRASSQPGTTTFVVGPYSPTSGNTFTDTSGYDLDDSTDPGNPAGSTGLYYAAAGTSFTVTTTTVPEPTATLAFAIMPFWISARRYRCRITP